MGGNLEHASRNTASIDKDGKSESVRRTLQDSNNLSLDVHGNVLDRNIVNKSDISKSSQGTRNHDVLGKDAGTQDSIYEKSLQDVNQASPDGKKNLDNSVNNISP